MFNYLEDMQTIQTFSATPPCIQQNGIFFYGLTYVLPETNEPKPVPLLNVNVEA